MNAVVLPDARRRSRLQLVLLAVLFAAPVISAWVAWKYAATEGVGATTNVGQLIRPARPLTAAPWLDVDGHPLSENLLRGRWSYVLFAPDGCTEACRERLHLTRQVRVSVNKDITRVQRLLVVRQPPADLDALRAAHPDLVIAVLGGSAWHDFAVQFAADGVDQAVYLVDPLGNLMMRYLPAVPFNGMLKDLRRLLKASQVG